MYLSHWMKGAVLLLYLAAMLFIINRCTRPTQTAAATSDPRHEANLVPPINSPVLKRADEEASRRRERAKRLAQERAEHHLLEAHLTRMLHDDVPAALDELARAAVAYRNKLPDLKHLKQPDQWERETPVKEA